MDQSFASITPRSSSKSNITQSSSMEVGGNVTKRLSNELMTLMMSDSPGITAFPKSDVSLFEWTGTIEGADGTIYEGLAFNISISFPPNYPYKPPTIRFDSQCYHPNVDLHGNICLDILKEQWSAVYSVRTVLLSLQSLLGEPNNDSPLNLEAAGLWDNPEAFKEQLMKHYKPMDMSN